MNLFVKFNWLKSFQTTVKSEKVVTRSVNSGKFVIYLFSFRLECA